jgi:hypothetical protein
MVGSVEAIIAGFRPANSFPIIDDPPPATGYHLTTIFR